MKIDKEGIPFTAGGLGRAAARGGTGGYGGAAGLAALGGFFAYFFRAPDREIPAGRGLVVSRADGRVVIAGPADPRWSPPGAWQQVTIFLSPMDVHMNRTPVEGRVPRIEYRAGKFRPAYREAANQNRLNGAWIDHSGE